MGLAGVKVPSHQVLEPAQGSLRSSCGLKYLDMSVRLSVRLPRTRTYTDTGYASAPRPCNLTNLQAGRQAKVLFYQPLLLTVTEYSSSAAGAC